MIAIKITIETDIELSVPLQAALPQLVTDRETSWAVQAIVRPIAEAALRSRKRKAACGRSTPCPAVRSCSLTRWAQAVDDMLTGMAGSPDRPRVRTHARWLLAGYAGLAGFFALERLFRQPGSASSLQAGEGDRGTTRMIAVAYGLAADLPLLARWLPGRPLPPTVAPVGLVVEAAGLGVRAWSMRTLGSSYSRTLRTDDQEQALIDVGPYRLVRHPGYLGSLLTWAGFALTSRRVPVVGVILGLLGVAYGRRIAAEEQLLGRDLADYDAYSRKTKKLIPFIW